MVSRALLLNDSFCTRSFPREKPERPITSGLSGSTSSDAEHIRRKSEGSSRDRRRNLGRNASLRRLLGCRLDRDGNQIHQPAERATSAQIDAPVLDLVRYDNSTDVEA